MLTMDLLTWVGCFIVCRGDSKQVLADFYTKAGLQPGSSMLQSFPMT